MDYKQLLQMLTAHPAVLLQYLLSIYSQGPTFAVNCVPNSTYISVQLY